MNAPQSPSDKTPATTGPTDPTALLAQITLEESGSENPISDFEHEIGATTVTLEEWETPDRVAALSSLADDAYAPTVLAAVDALLRGGESLGSSARNRMVAGAERAIRRRHALQNGLLPVALRAVRETELLTQDELAQTIGVSARTVAAIELGQEPVQALSPEKLASWIRAVGLPSAQALPALQRSLTERTGDGVYAARVGKTEGGATEARTFYDRVAALLDADKS